jgi:hypothetical protein
VLLVGVLLAGCGGGHASTSAEQRLQREHLIAVAQALERLEAPVSGEVAATKAAWPQIANGLPTDTTTVLRAPIRAAAAAASKLVLPALFEEATSSALTGPAAGLAGLFRSYSFLASRGWRLVEAALDQIEHGPPVAARFARANVALYIESIYDAHFGLGKIGKGLLKGYDELGGERMFGAALTRADVERLARTYSEERNRLHPHVGVRLGS